MTNIVETFSFSHLCRLGQGDDVEAFRYAVEIVKRCGGESLNGLGADEKTLLHFIATKGNSKGLRVLLEEEGSRMDGLLPKVDKYGRTALHLAAIGGHVECIEELVKEHDLASLSLLLLQQDTSGRTALQCASRHRVGKRSGESVRAILRAAQGVASLVSPSTLSPTDEEEEEQQGQQQQPHRHLLKSLLRSLDGGKYTILYGASAEALEAVWEFATETEDREFLLREAEDQAETMLRSVSDPAAVSVLLRIASSMDKTGKGEISQVDSLSLPSLLSSSSPAAAEGSSWRRQMVFAVTESKLTCLHRMQEDVLGALLSSLTPAEVEELARMEDAKNHPPLHHFAFLVQRKALETMVGWIKGQQRPLSPGVDKDKGTTITHRTMACAPSPPARDSLLNAFNSQGMTPLHTLLMTGSKFIWKTSADYTKAVACLLGAPEAAPSATTTRSPAFPPVLLRSPSEDSKQAIILWDGADPNLGCRLRVALPTGIV